MAWSAPKTWIAGETLEASEFNTQIRDNFIETRHTLDRNTTETVHGSSAAQTTLYSYVVPANTLGTNGALKLTVLTNIFNAVGTTQNATWRLKYGTTTFAQAIIDVPTGTNGLIAFHAYIIGGGATNEQHCWAYMQGIPDSFTDQAFAALMTYERDMVINSTLAQTLEVTVQFGLAHANLTCEREVAILERF